MKQPESYRKVFLLFLAVVSIGFIWVLTPLYGAVFWGFTLAVIFMPLNDMILLRMPRKRNTAALITVLICFFIAILPIAFMIVAMVQESMTLYQRFFFDHVTLETTARHLIARLPHWLTRLINHFGSVPLEELNQRLADGLMQFGQHVAAWSWTFGQNVLNFVISFFIMLYLLFFLLRDGRRLGAKIRRVIPLRERYKHTLLNKFISVIRATVKGNFVIALVQAILAVIIFYFLNIEGVLLWAILIALVSLLPSGSGVIWIPLGIYYLSTGAYMKGIVLIVACILIIGVIDNILRPMLVGKDTQIPDYLVLISTIGGMALFGLNGFIIGPVIAALFITAWDLTANFSAFGEDAEIEDEKRNF